MLKLSWMNLNLIRSNCLEGLGIDDHVIFQAYFLFLGVTQGASVSFRVSDWQHRKPNQCFFKTGKSCGRFLCCCLCWRSSSPDQLVWMSLFPEALNVNWEEALESVKGRLLQKLAHSKLEKNGIAFLTCWSMSKDRTVCRTFISCFLLYHYSEGTVEPNATQTDSVKGILIQLTYI